MKINITVECESVEEAQGVLAQLNSEGSDAETTTTAAAPKGKAKAKAKGKAAATTEPAAPAAPAPAPSFPQVPTMPPVGAAPAMPSTPAPSAPAPQWPAMSAPTPAAPAPAAAAPVIPAMSPEIRQQYVGYLGQAVPAYFQQHGNEIGGALMTAIYQRINASMGTKVPDLSDDQLAETYRLLEANKASFPQTRQLL